MYLYGELWICRMWPCIYGIDKYRWMTDVNLTPSWYIWIGASSLTIYNGHYTALSPPLQVISIISIWYNWLVVDEEDHEMIESWLSTIQKHIEKVWCLLIYSYLWRKWMAYRHGMNSSKTQTPRHLRHRTHVVIILPFLRRCHVIMTCTYVTLQSVWKRCLKIHWTFREMSVKILICADTCGRELWIMSH